MTERLAVTDGEGREVSHLAVRFDPAPEGSQPPLGILYLHGFGSHQAGEKAEFFRARAREAGIPFCSFDFQGHGASGGVLAELTLTRNLADVARVRALLAWAGPERTRAWRDSGRIHFENEHVSSELSWSLIEDLRAHPAEQLAQRLKTPALLLQGKRDTSVSWRHVADFAARCRSEEVELHVFADGDHRLTDRKGRLWDLMQEFLRGRGLL